MGKNPDISHLYVGYNQFTKLLINSCDILVCLWARMAIWGYPAANFCGYMSDPLVDDVSAEIPWIINLSQK